MSTETNTYSTETQLSSISPWQYEAVRRRQVPTTPCVTEDDRAVVITARRNLDKILELITIIVERSSSTAREGQEGIREDSLTSISGGVRLPLDGRVKEYVPGKGENVIHSEKYIQGLSGFILAIVALLVLAGFIRLSIFNTEYLFLILAMALAGLFFYFRLH